MSNFGVSASKYVCAAALLSATISLSACGGGAGASFPTLAARSTPRGGAVENNRHTYVTPCSFSGETKNRLYVANEGAGLIVRFNPPNTDPETVNVTSEGIDVKFDHHKNMWVSEWQQNTIYEFAPPYNGAPIGFTYAVLNGPRAIAFDGANWLYIADIADNRIAILAPPYTAYTAASVSVLSPSSLAFDASCNLWVASGRNSVVEFQPPYTSPPLNTISIDGAYSVAFDAKNDLFVGTLDRFPQDEIFEYAPPYNGLPIAREYHGLQGVVGIDLDAHGNLFASSTFISEITEYKPPYDAPPVLTLSSANGLSYQQGIVFGPK